MTEGKIRLLRPVPKAFPITSPYGKHRLLTINGQTTSRPHLGIDFGCPPGTPVFATRDADVQTVGWQNALDPKEGFGMRIVLRFTDPEFGTVFCYLAHLSEIKVNAHTKVAQGQIIAKTGNTGRSTGAHLHIECRLTNLQDRLDMDFFESPLADKMRTA